MQVEVMEGFGMKTTELTKLKKALKKLRKKLRADSKKRVASEAKAEVRATLSSIHFGGVSRSCLVSATSVLSRPCSHFFWGRKPWGVHCHTYEAFIPTSNCVLR